jgi:hypothetical protein
MISMIVKKYKLTMPESVDAIKVTKPPIEEFDKYLKELIDFGLENPRIVYGLKDFYILLKNKEFAKEGSYIVHTDFECYGIYSETAFLKKYLEYSEKE